jgi:hypothetical protein
MLILVNNENETERYLVQRLEGTYMRVSFLLASMGFFFFMGACNSGPATERPVHEALLERNNLPSAIFNNPYGTTSPATNPVTSKVNWIEASPDTGPTNRNPSYNRPDDGEEQAKREALCTSVEYPAEGRIGAADRRHLQASLNDAKEDLLAWVEHHHVKFPTGTYETLRNQIRALRLGEPGPGEDPDLGYRGIGVWTRDAKGPVVRLGPGFVTLLKKDPERARFELIRLAAQGWAPCELLRLGAPEPWSAYLRCMGIQETETGCGVGDYSEAGWAVSSAVASVLAKPGRVGCTIPAFADEAHAECPKNFLLPLSIGGEKISLRSFQ